MVVFAVSLWIQGACTLPVRSREQVTRDGVPGGASASNTTPITSPRYLQNVAAWDTTNLPLSPRLLLDPDFDTPYQKADPASHGDSSLVVITGQPPHLIWTPTVPFLDTSGRSYAGWYDTANPQDKATITEYLNSAWLYPLDKGGLAQTRQRMREQIGEEEAKILKDWQRHPSEAYAIAMSTISKQKDPTNSLNTPRGRGLFEQLMYTHNIGSVTAGDAVRYALEVEHLGHQDDSHIIHHILSKYQASRARGKNKAS